MGKDVRFQIKDLEQASMMDDDDFLSGKMKPPSPSPHTSVEKPRLVFSATKKPPSTTSIYSI